MASTRSQNFLKDHQIVTSSAKSALVFFLILFSSLLIYEFLLSYLRLSSDQYFTYKTVLGTLNIAFVSRIIFAAFASLIFFAILYSSLEKTGSAISKTFNWWYVPIFLPAFIIGLISLQFLYSFLFIQIYALLNITEAMTHVLIAREVTQKTLLVCGGIYYYLLLGIQSYM